MYHVIKSLRDFMQRGFAATKKGNSYTIMMVAIGRHFPDTSLIEFEQLGVEVLGATWSRYCC